MKEIIKDCIKEILMGDQTATPPVAVDDENPSGLAGAYVIMRTRMAGVWAGTLDRHGDRFCILKDARRLQYHNPGKGNAAWYEGVSRTGLHSSSRVSVSVPTQFANEDYQIIPCTPESEKSIKEAPLYEATQNS